MADPNAPLLHHPVVHMEQHQIHAIEDVMLKNWVRADGRWDSFIPPEKKNIFGETGHNRFMEFKKNGNNIWQVSLVQSWFQIQRRGTGCSRSGVFWTHSQDGEGAKTRSERSHEGVASVAPVCLRQGGNMPFSCVNKLQLTTCFQNIKFGVYNLVILQNLV